MKLRNKRTGETKKAVFLSWFDGIRERYFSSIEEAKSFLEDWEDYTPQEPLTKDEKIDYLEIKRLVKEAMREAEEERVKRLAQYYAELCGSEE